MKVFFYDPAKPDRQRPWVALLGRCSECEWDTRTGGFITAASEPISDAIIVAHYSKLFENGISQEKIELFASGQKGSTVIVVSGGLREWQSHVANVYFRKASVGYSNDDPFRGYFARFREQLGATGEKVFRILDSECPVLTSIVIFGQLYAATGIARRIIPSDAPLARELGWELLGNEKLACLSSRLADRWSQLCKSDWWRSSLGIGADEQGKPAEDEFKRVLIRLIQELGAEIPARQKFKVEFNLPADASMEGIPFHRLSEFLKSDTCQPGPKILELLQGSKIEPALIESILISARTML